MGFFGERGELWKKKCGDIERGNESAREMCRRKSLDEYRLIIDAVELLTVALITRFYRMFEFYKISCVLKQEFSIARVDKVSLHRLIY